MKPRSRSTAFHNNELKREFMLVNATGVRLNPAVSAITERVPARKRLPNTTHCPQRPIHILARRKWTGFSSLLSRELRSFALSCPELKYTAK